MRTLPYIAIIAALAGAPVEAGTIYEITNLGTFGGDGSRAVAIAPNGLVAGGALTAAGENRAFVYESGLLRDLENAWSVANGINSSGAEAGTAYGAAGAQAMLWGGVGRTVLGTLGGTESEAMAINSSGMVVGRADTASGQGHAFSWRNGRMEDLGTLPGGTWSAAYAVNDAGQAVGYGLDSGGLFRAFMTTPRLGLMEIDTLGGNAGYAFGINNRGDVVGHSSVSGGYLHAYLYADGRIMDLGTLGGNQSFAYGVSNQRGVVGYSEMSGSGYTHAYVYRDGTMTDLNSLIDPASGWLLLEAYGINERGQIVGVGLYESRRLGYRLDPRMEDTVPSGASAGVVAEAPEPATLLLIGIGLIAVGLLGRRLPPGSPKK